MISSRIELRLNKNSRKLIGLISQRASMKRGKS